MATFSSRLRTSSETSEEISPRLTRLGRPDGAGVDVGAALVDRALLRARLVGVATRCGSGTCGSGAPSSSSTAASAKCSSCSSAGGALTSLAAGVLRPGVWAASAGGASAAGVSFGAVEATCSGTGSFSGDRRGLTSGGSDGSACAACSGGREPLALAVACCVGVREPREGGTSLPLLPTSARGRATAIR